MSQPEAKKASELDLEISLAVPGDEDIIASLVFEAFSPFREEYTPDAFDYTAVSAERVLGLFAEGPIWIAYLGGEPVGTVSGLPEEERFYIRSMAIRPTVQRGGIGQRLLETLDTHAKRVLKSCTSTPPSSCPVRRGCTRRMDFMS